MLNDFFCTEARAYAFHLRAISRWLSKGKDEARNLSKIRHSGNEQQIAVESDRLGTRRTHKIVAVATYLRPANEVRENQTLCRERVKAAIAFLGGARDIQDEVIPVPNCTTIPSGKTVRLSNYASPLFHLRMLLCKLHPALPTGSLAPSSLPLSATNYKKRSKKIEHARSGYLAVFPRSGILERKGRKIDRSI